MPPRARTVVNNVIMRIGAWTGYKHVLQTHYNVIYFWLSDLPNDVKSATTPKIEEVRLQCRHVMSRLSSHTHPHLNHLVLRSCDADPSALANYVVALVKKDKPEKELKALCADQLDVFLQQGKAG